MKHLLIDLSQTGVLVAEIIQVKQRFQLKAGIATSARGKKFFAFFPTSETTSLEEVRNILSATSADQPCSTPECFNIVSAQRAEARARIGLPPICIECCERLDESPIELDYDDHAHIRRRQRALAITEDQLHGENS